MPTCDYKNDSDPCEGKVIYVLVNTKDSPIACKKHGEPKGMKDKYKAYCQLCVNRASYGKISDNKMIRCKEHHVLEDGTILLDLTNKKMCKRCNEKQPSYNLEGLEPLYCEECALTINKDMINVRGKKCSNSGCKKQPSFNYPDKKGGDKCSEHALSGMMDVVHSKCLKCGLDASFNYKGESKRLYCEKDSLPNMINLAYTYCAFADCVVKNPTFGSAGKMVCELHKTPEMTAPISEVISESDNKCVKCHVRNGQKSFKMKCRKCYDEERKQ